MVPPSEYLQDVHPRLSLGSRLKVGSQVYAMVALMRSVTWARECYQYMFSSECSPDMIKTYATRPGLAVRLVYFLQAEAMRCTVRNKLHRCATHATTDIANEDTSSFFVPSKYSKRWKSLKLPSLFTIHGGGFTIGAPIDDDKWNRTFAETSGAVVIALHYSKAPLSPFPTPVYDVEALILAILQDTGIPIDTKNCAIAGFSAGGTLALIASQLPNIKAAFRQCGSDGFKAVVPLYPVVDKTVTRLYKATQRQYKSELTPNRNGNSDYLLQTGKLLDWAYIPPGLDLQDPLLSPIFISRTEFPPHIFLIACELDLSCHEAWRMACRLAGLPAPEMNDKCGRMACGPVGELELSDTRFAWEDQATGVRWMLVPDVLHAFDRLPPMLQGDNISVQDAEMKNIKVIQEISAWLNLGVWVLT